MSSSRADLLTDRNRMLEMLWEMDNELRAWHASGVWKSSVDADQTAAIYKKMDERHILAQGLREIGCVPWDFHPHRDNSWLVGLRNMA
ncbi:hypothetical protein SSEA_SKINNY_52 [Mycobacterium phage Skinny]|uniref:Uncharacterized protein n=5 Tax=Bongovirus bongo TaxID=1983750 RepID=A0A514DJ43_9CAUD|nr:hypothetical protein PEGLEG_51 [Mycobacterium phage PegLeg]YP_009604909.1 hypothetical protein FDH95_gp051 [Mycobacterium phage Bongo]AXQ52692.1 hypothetical protein SEA_IPHANE7_51 [Mycobacterium phage IPhane7]QDH93624.1 hypothetical protein SEA_LILHOMIEP_50 [Mycobacterium phage LilhomieP]QGJ93198.1 hypothetical protein SEA_TYDAWG_51 [Mycobacterium phage TyDawg]UXE05255.1 hypothetical protein SSEA_SKINNY_52 [Mycobacterium phage Skinny]WMI33232.1 hypothetical protein SEA_SLIMJIMMY_50 [Mycob